MPVSKRFCAVSTNTADRSPPMSAGPIALAKAGVLAGRRVTSYPGFEPQLGDVEFVEDTVVTDGTLVTSRGPGTAMAFALALVERLRGAEVARDVGARMLVR